MRDPAGAARAVRVAALPPERGRPHRRRSDDPRTAFLLHYVARAFEAGWLTDSIGADLVARLTLQHRNERYGRGVNDGSMLSPLGRDDLSHALVAIYQNPLQHVEQPHRTLTFDSRNRLEQVMDGVGSVVDGVDAIAALDAGYLIGKAIGPKETTKFSVAMIESGPFSSFRTFAGHQALAQAAPHLASDLTYDLDRLEAALLLRRCACGWSEQAPALLNIPSSELITKLEAVMGRFDATVLGRPQDQSRRRR